MKPECQLRVGSRRQSDAARAGDGEPRRGSGDFAGQFLASKDERPGHLSDAFLAHEQIVDAQPDVVSRQVERAAATRRKLGQARQWGPWVPECRNPLDRNAPAVGVERIRPIPRHKRRARHRTAALLEIHAVQTHARPIETQ